MIFYHFSDFFSDFLSDFFSDFFRDFFSDFFRDFFSDFFRVLKLHIDWLLIKLKLVHVVETARAERNITIMMIFFIFRVIFIRSSSVEAVMPEYLPVNRAVSRDDAIENYFSLGFTGSEILSFLLNVHGIRLSLRQLRRILKNRGCTRREQSTDMDIIVRAVEGELRGKPQLSALDIETTRSLANVRIHVERVIGTIRQKYAILGHSVIPIHYLMSDGNESSLLDKIAVVCCALTNCCKSVIASD